MDDAVWLSIRLHGRCEWIVKAQMPTPPVGGFAEDRIGRHHFPAAQFLQHGSGAVQFFLCQIAMAEIIGQDQDDVGTSGLGLVVFGRHEHMGQECGQEKGDGCADR